MKKAMPCVRELEPIGKPCTVEIKTYPSNFAYPLHWHDYFECELLLSGRAEHTCNGRQYEVKRGDAWVMSYYDFHAFSAIEDVRFVHICFERNMLLPELEERFATGGACATLNGDRLDEACRLVTLLEAEKGDRELSKLSRKLLLNRLLVLILRDAEEGVQEPSSTVGVVLVYLHRHFKEPITLSEMARMQGLSQNYLGHCFAASVGVSFRTYLNKIRLKYACGLLVTSELSTKEIAFAAGYASIEYFFSVFKKSLGMTPVAYRERMMRGANE